MKKILIYILKIFSKLVLKKYRPRVIAITGSVGKTSTKEAIFQILSSRFDVERSSGNYNNEIGVPLSILGITKSPGKSIISWLKIFNKAWIMLIFNKYYPKKIILEMGADHPGDIEYLTSFVPVDIAILTRISKVHTEFFKNIDEILKEKRKIFNNVNAGAWAVLNNDDENIRKIKHDLKCKVITYGINTEADIQASDLQIIRKGEIIGINFKIKHNGNVVPFFLPNCLGLVQIYSFLGAATVGILEGFNLVEMSILVKNYSCVRGRNKLIAGINSSYIIDDTYNSSPDALKAAVDLLGNLKTLINGQKIVVLGDMLELGRESKSLHGEVGEYIAQQKIDMLLTVGDRANDIYLGAQKKGMDKEYNIHFNNQEDLVDYLRKNISKDSMILVKGSQGTRMEKVVKNIMKNPGLASQLLVRQDSKWLKL